MPNTSEPLLAFDVEANVAPAYVCETNALWQLDVPLLDKPTTWFVAVQLPAPIMISAHAGVALSAWLSVCHGDEEVPELLSLPVEET
jgi:hypothetical protein